MLNASVPNGNGVRLVKSFPVPTLLMRFYRSRTATSTDCDVNTDGNSGCAVQAPTDDSYGPDFNSAGGGYYTMERTGDYINVWFWSRTDGTVPLDVLANTGSVDTSNWVCFAVFFWHGSVTDIPSLQGTPVANFPDTSCDIDSVFGANNIIFDLTLCEASNRVMLRACGLTETDRSRSQAARGPVSLRSSTALDVQVTVSVRAAALLRPVTSCSADPARLREQQPVFVFERLLGRRRCSRLHIRLVSWSRSRARRWELTAAHIYLHRYAFLSDEIFGLFSSHVFLIPKLFSLYLLATTPS